MKQKFRIALATAAIAASFAVEAQDGGAAGVAAQGETSAAIHSLRQTLSTDAYAGILKALVTPSTLNNPMEVCAQCHAAEDVVRYTRTLGPMLQMVNPVNWINPTAYWNMAVPMVDPQTYTDWYNAYIKKYGGLLGYGQGDDAEQPTPSGE